MDKIEVTCVKAHTYDNLFRLPGEVFFVRRRHLKVLVALKRVSEVVDLTSNVVPLSSRSKKAVGVDTGVSVTNGTDIPDDGAEAVRRALRAEYKELFGKDAHGRTSVDKLRSEIASKKAESNG